MRLHSKFFVWAGLNLIWLATLIGAVLLFGVIKYDGRFPHIFFQGGINAAMQIVAANLQYKSIGMWEKELLQCSRSFGITFMVHSLDPEDPIHGMPAVPQRVLDTAWRIPRPRIEICPGPSGGEIPMEERVELQNGFLPSLNALFLKEGGNYWYGRPAIIPDDIYEPRYVLLAAVSPSITGNGLFFRVGEALWLAALCLLLSFLWWLPFVLYITRPLERLTLAAENIAEGNSPLQEEKNSESSFLFPEKRHDEIGRLALALESMSSQLFRQMLGQRRFIRHIAHELGAPLARAKFGLEVLQSRLNGENAQRTENVIQEVEQVSELVEDVLGYLRSEGLPRNTHLESFEPCAVIHRCTLEEARHVAVDLDLPDALPLVSADRACFQRAVCNVVRNAVRYAADCGPIAVSAACVGRECRVRVADCGPGVGEGELEHLTEPFFRGASGERYSGGSGLGLSIVRHCVEQCHGRMEMYNLRPTGFCVDLYFPTA